MTNPDIATTEQAVATLFLERQRYEQWLAGLEAKRSATAPHVFQRVHADYTARLQHVVEQLLGHTTAIQELANSLADRLTSLDIDDMKMRDELAEAELRAAVGEYSADYCSAQIDRCRQSLELLNEERASLTAELARLRSVLEHADARNAEEAGRASSGEQQQVGTSPAQPAAAEDVPAPAPARASGPVVAPRRTSDGFDELEFLKSLGAAEGAAGDQRAEAPAPANAAAGERIRQESPVAGGSDVVSGSSLSPSDVSLPEPRASRELRESIPSFLKDVPPEQVKTLKCQDCGTLNYPTEWYCERCGAELAAL